MNIMWTKFSPCKILIKYLLRVLKKYLLKECIEELLCIFGIESNLNDISEKGK